MSKPFELGICMAGAVSAGAYTAGVMDFLMEALQTWEDRRGQPDVPAHEVLIKAIGGASAGGMTGIIAASALNNPIDPITELDQDDFWKEQSQNKFYNTWVDLLQNDMFPMMLETDDIKREKVYALFNSDFIDKVGKKCIAVDKNNYIERPYIDNQLKFFTTLTNVEGFKYNTDFLGNSNSNLYHLAEHKDYGTFVLNTAQSSYAGDGWIPVDFFKGVNTDIALHCAMATGAFPGGLKPRKVWRHKKYVNDLDWNKPVVKHFPVKDNMTGPNPIPGIYEALIVDGGTINNEPFEQVANLLTGVDADENKFSATTLMIDPFPSYAEVFDLTKDYMLPVLGGTLSAMLSQMRAKPDVLESIMLSNDVSKYQIAPVKYLYGERIEGSKAIACGFMGGFGGFIHKEFRIHDFFLGRANCEHFLREHFTVSSTNSNPIFTAGYNSVKPGLYESKSGKKQIIPIFKKQGQPYMPIFQCGTTWPRRTKEDYLRFEPDIEKRVSALTMNLVKLNLKQRLLLGLGNKILLKKRMTSAVLSSIKNAMKAHQLL